MSGQTTTIGKLATTLKNCQSGLGAADTFRAAIDYKFNDRVSSIVRQNMGRIQHR
jgi:signal recognition particle GTPase